MADETMDAADIDLQVRLDALKVSQGSATIAELFDAEPDRLAAFSVEAAGLLFDGSKNAVSGDTLVGLLALARDHGLEAAREAMFQGQSINTTEGRAVLHTALRADVSTGVTVGGIDCVEAAKAERQRMLAFVHKVHSGAWVGATGKPITDVVNIGIGGSDLGPVMVTEALRPYWVSGVTAHFVSNVDGQHIVDTLAGLSAETTLFIIASKTFTTQETMTNAATARSWALSAGVPEEDLHRHFVALSTNKPAVEAFGIDPENMFVFWDWVGGRYSLWSVIGLSIALAVGPEAFEALLRGAADMDHHFRTAPLADNMPVLMGLLGLWNRNALGISTHAVLPYDQHLHRFPAYLQQADMESNGKAIRKDGSMVRYATGPILFGEAGTNGQHAFYQLIHQGTDTVSTDFIAAATSHSETGDHHPKLLANFLAQPRALMIGKSESDVRSELDAKGLSAPEVDALAPHKVFEGNRPSNTLLMDKLTPSRLGALIALYEHKIFVQGVLWGINSYDQWGVELGKVLASDILPRLEGEGTLEGLDPSTAHLIREIRRLRQSEAD